MFSCPKRPSWLQLPWKNKDDDNIIGKDGKRRKLKRRRLVPPASLYQLYVHQQGVDNFDYETQIESVAPDDSCRLSLNFVKLIKKYDEELIHKMKRYLSNKIRTTKYTILSFLPKNLFEQFHRVANFYFLMLIALNFVPQLEVFAKEISMIPLIVVLTLQALKDGFEDFSRYCSDKQINNANTNVFRR